VSVICKVFEYCLGWIFDDLEGKKGKKVRKINGWKIIFSNFGGF
jgi:hypothetical protein